MDKGYIEFLNKLEEAPKLLSRYCDHVMRVKICKKKFCLYLFKAIMTQRTKF